MKVDLFETHDRLLHFHKQADYISHGCADCIANRPSEFGNHPFYIFAHARTDDDGVTKRLIWSPRLTKPKPQTNSMLFKAYPPGDNIRVIWMIPDRALWKQYKKGNVTESDIIEKSIEDFQYNRKQMSAKEDDDLSDEKIDAIYQAISSSVKYDKLLKSLYLKQDSLEPYQASFSKVLPFPGRL